MAQVGFIKGLIIKKKTYERLLFIDYHILRSYGNEGSLFQVPRETATATKTSLRCYKRSLRKHPFLPALRIRSWGRFAAAKSEEKRMFSQATTNFIALFSSCSTRQMLANVFGPEFLKTVSKLRKRKRESLSCVHVPH